MDLLALRRWGSAVPPLGLPDELNELRLHHLHVLRGVMAELYSECFSEEQIQVLLDF